MDSTSGPAAESLGELTDSSPFDVPVCLWRCASCGGHFAAEHHDIHSGQTVGIYLPTVNLARNRKINEVRRRWQELRTAGSICTCDRSTSNWFSRWELYDVSDESLVEHLPETRDEATAAYESFYRIVDGEDEDELDTGTDEA